MDLIKEEAKKILFKEVIEEGLDKCVPTGFVSLVKDDISPSAYRFYIFENKEDKTPYAIGVLEKRLRLCLKSPNIYSFCFILNKKISTAGKLRRLILF
jgi:hypothetical protein